MTDLDARIAKLRAELAALPLGEDDGQRPLGAPTGEAAVLAVELAHGIRLPEDYRRFLIEVGDGGPGPSYGLYSLAEAIAERGDGVWSLADPFEPPASCRDWVDLRAPGILPVQYEGCSYYAGLVITGPDRGTMWSYVEVEPGWVPFVADLIDEHGAPYQLRGSEMADYRAWYDVMLAPQNRGRRRSFLDWYEDWLAGVRAS